jgi:hypothetical protein
VNGEESAANRIREAGWRQGAVLRDQDVVALREHMVERKIPEPMESGWWIVITHDCDLLNSNFEKEPWFELLRGSPLGKKKHNRGGGG